MFEIAVTPPTPQGNRGAPDVAANPALNGGAGAAETSPDTAFQAVLARQTGTLPPVAVATPVADATDAAGAVTIAVAIAALPEGGKGLPGGLTGLAALPVATEADSATTAETDATLPVRVNVAVRPVLLRNVAVPTLARTPAKVTEKTSDEASDKADPSAEAPADPTAPVQPQVPVIVSLTVQATVDGTAPVVAQDVLASARGGLVPQPATPPVAAGPVPATPIAPEILSTTFERQERAVPVAATPADAVQAAREPTSTAQALRAARAGTVAEDVSAAPRPAHATRPAVLRETEIATSEEAAVSTVATVFARADAVPAPQDPKAPQAVARPERIDFATLVDSIARARDDGAGATVNVAVSHGDFGKVSLRFENGDNGLSVAMSSADPGFARAVAASGQADGGTFNADSQQSQQQQQAQQQQRAAAGNGSAQSALGGDGSSPSRGGGSGRQDGAAQANPRAAANAPQSDETPRDGIFA